MSQNTETVAVGTGATFTVWTDAYACTVVEVRRNGREVVLRRDKATLLNGFNSGEADALEFTPGGFCGHVEGCQRYAYEPNPEGELFVVTRRTKKNKSVVWKQKGLPTKQPGGYASFGRRSEHYDYNF